MRQIKIKDKETETMKIGKQSFLKITPFLMVLFSMCFVETPALSASRGGRSAEMVIENKSSQFA